jgi:hypothetical protein
MPTIDTTNYGSDLSTYANPASGIADLDPTFTVISGPRVVVERIARKLMTPTGSMLKAGWGFDLRSVLQSSLTSAQVNQLRGILQDQIEQEPEVDSVDLRIDYTLQLRRMDITGTLTLITGEEFPLVFIITPELVQPIIDDITGVTA